MAKRTTAFASASGIRGLIIPRSSGFRFLGVGNYRDYGFGVYGQGLKVGDIGIGVKFMGFVRTKSASHYFRRPGFIA